MLALYKEITKGSVKVKHRPKLKQKKIREPNIVAEYLRAAKHRYCPIVQFIEPEPADIKQEFNPVTTNDAPNLCPINYQTYPKSSQLISVPQLSHRR